MSALAVMGAKSLMYLVPNRFAGMAMACLRHYVDHAAQTGRNELLITVGGINGISSHAGVERANQLGLEVIITDHHFTSGHLAACGCSWLTQTADDCHVCEQSLAGGGWRPAFLSFIGDSFVVSPTSIANIPRHKYKLPMDYLDLVALGTVADVVALDFNNRILVQQGVQRIREGRCRPGIMALLQVAGRDPQGISATDLGFAVGPRINAAGRLDDIQMGHRLFAGGRHAASKNARLTTG